MKKIIIFKRTKIGMSFSNARNLLMECFDPNIETCVITDPKTDFEFLKKAGYRVEVACIQGKEGDDS